VTAARSMSGGNLVFASAGTASLAATTAVTQITPAGQLAREGVMVGDIVRLHGNVGQMQVTALALETAGGDILTMDGSSHAFDSAASSDDGVASGAEKIVIRESGFSYKVQFDGTSGDVANLVCDSSNLRPVYRLPVAGYVTRDEPDRIYFVDATQGSSQPAYKDLTNNDRSHPEAVSAGDIVYIGEQRCEVVSSDDGAAGSFAAKLFVYRYHATSVVCKDALKANWHSTATEIYTHETLEVLLGHETVTCASTDTPHLRFARTLVTQDQDALCSNGEGCADVFDYNGEKRMVVHAKGTTKPTTQSPLTNTLLDLNDLAVGDRVMIDTLGHTQEIRTVDSIHIGQATGSSQNNYFTVSQPFSAGHTNSDIFLYWKGSTGSATCSGRGICDEGTGDCQCFRGYTGQACQVQNALAA